MIAIFELIWTFFVISPLQGFVTESRLNPRAMPWAGIGLPRWGVHSGKAAGVTPKGSDKPAPGNAWGMRDYTKAKPQRGEIMKRCSGVGSACYHERIGQDTIETASQ